MCYARRAMKWALLPACAAVAAALSASARADCTPPNRLSTCIDADTFWRHAAPDPSSSFPGTRIPPPGQMGFGVTATYLVRPVIVVARPPARSPTRSQPSTELVDTTFLWSVGLTERAELDLAVPVTTYRTGAGISPVAEQHGSRSRHFAARHTYWSAYALVTPGDTGSDAGFGLKSRLELSLPVGDETSFAGDRLFVGIPALAGDYRAGPIFAGGEVGARLRQTADFGGSRVIRKCFSG